MTTLQRERKLAKTYLSYIEKLSPEVKLDIISKISISMTKKAKEKISPEAYFAGAWESDETPEEFADSLRSARIFNRKSVEL